MAFLVGGANTLTAGYNIDNSLRFAKGDTAYMTNATGGTSTLNTKITLSLWMKICDNTYDDTVGICWGYVDASNRFGISMYQDKIIIYQNSAGTAGEKRSDSIRYRDESAWYHIVVAVDTTQGTAANRTKLYVNGVAAEISAGDYPAEDATIAFTQNVTQSIGANWSGSAWEGHWDGYLSEFYCIDGIAYDADDFGETDEKSGIWKPKDAKDDLTFGNNGFYLEFKNSAVGTGASDTIGADTSGKDQHFTSVNVAVVDNCTDSPTNNFATFNPLEAIDTSIDPDQLSEGNLRLKGRTSASSGAGDVITRSSIKIPTTGKWYAEYYNDGSDSNTILIGLADASLTNHRQAYHTGVYVRCDNGNKYTITTSSTDNGSYATGWDAGDIFGVAYDADAGTLTYYLNGSTQGTAFSSLTGEYFFGTATIGGADLLATVNFGNPPFAISSGNADANGYGNFEYAPPSGHYALCTKNLAEFG